MGGVLIQGWCRGGDVDVEVPSIVTIGREWESMTRNRESIDSCMGGNVRALSFGDFITDTTTAGGTQ